jgi:hypothetical protein
MSDGGRGRVSLGVEMWKSSQNVDAERSGVRSIAWLGVRRGYGETILLKLHCKNFDVARIKEKWRVRRNGVLDV